MATRARVLVVLGATGTGKSDVAVALAHRLRGEVINSDAMQMYQGLDIATNKHPLAARADVPHHLLDVVAAPAAPWTVSDFQSAARDVIASCSQRRTLPILVGGTNYYVEAALWPSFIDSSRTSSEPPVSSFDDVKASVIQRLSSAETDSGNRPDTAAVTTSPHQLLALVDPGMAQRVHPNDERKSLRSLQVYAETGQLHSDVLAQHPQRSLGADALLYDTCFVYLDTRSEDRAWYRKRLDDRVDAMLQRGLLEEIKGFRTLLQQPAATTVSMQHGILQTIGFKEFAPYLDGVSDLASCVATMKTATWRYAKRQATWLRNRLVTRPGLLVYRYLVQPGVDLDRDVVVPAAALVQQWLDGTPDTAARWHAPASSLTSLDTEDAQRVHRRCSVCDRSLQGQQQWQVHLRSRSHRRAVRRRDTVRVAAVAQQAERQDH